jgi:hypothetical protein
MIEVIWTVSFFAVLAAAAYLSFALYRQQKREAGSGGGVRAAIAASLPRRHKRR